MKRLIALMSAAIIAAGMFTSCRKTYPYDTDKAISLATEYMKNKYGKDIKDIETYKKTHGSDAYIGVKFKLDEIDAETPDTNTYEVRVYVDGEGKENHYVKCDNYMNTLFEPVFKKKTIEELNENEVECYDLEFVRLHQIGTKDTAYYLSGFSIPDEGLKIGNVLKEYDLWFDCLIYLPETHYNDAQIRIEKVFKSYICNDDIISLGIYAYTDSEYQKYKEAQQMGKSDFSLAELPAVEKSSISFKQEEN